MSSAECFSVNTSKIIFESFEDELVLINLETGTYYSFNKTGADIWSLVEKGHPVSAITSSLTQRYDGAAETIENEAARFVGELKSEDLITPSECSADVPDATPADGERAPFEAPALNKYSDMEALLTLDPVHEVDETGWPNVKPETTGKS